MQRNPDFARLERDYGISFPYEMDWIKPGIAHDWNLAQDAQPTLVSTPNSAVPAFLTNFLDPDFVKVLVSPMKAALIIGEAKKGSWTDQTAMFPIIERTGLTSSYGDYSENGSVGSNFDFPQRQNYRYQTITQWGELELEKAALAKISWAAQLNEAAALTMNKFQNKVYFFGVGGLQNYGLLNDPSLSAALTPTTKVAGGTTWITAAGVPNATANEVVNDIQKMVYTLINQSGGVIQMDDDLVLAMHPLSSIAMTITNIYNVNVMDIVRKIFPKLRLETAVEYSLTAGYEVQLIAPKVEGQDTGYCAFSEKMRAHRIVPAMSSFRQKKSGGVWGAVIRQPFAVVSMVGV